MHIQEITQLFKQYWKPGYGSASPDELDFIQRLIEKVRPTSFIEVGMASGMSTGFIAIFMDELSKGNLLSIDHDNEFFGDKSKENGFLLPELYRGTKIKVDLIKHKTALDVDEFDRTFDMAFIDANHQHPWPAIDTMALYPKLTGPKLIVHHDLRLYMKQDVMYGIGPKYLYDQFPDSHREKSNANDGNIFVVDLSMGQEQFEGILTDLFKLPWSLRTPIQPHYIEKIRDLIDRYYSEELLTHFDRCLKIQNEPDRQLSGL